MDCYIVRVYRHITHKDGQNDEIAGLVERVGKQDSGKPFSTYSGLIDAMRDGTQAASTDNTNDNTIAVDHTDSGIRAIHSGLGR